MRRLSRGHGKADGRGFEESRSSLSANKTCHLQSSTVRIRARPPSVLDKLLECRRVEGKLSVRHWRPEHLATSCGWLICLRRRRGSRGPGTSVELRELRLPRVKTCRERRLLEDSFGFRKIGRLPSMPESGCIPQSKK